MCTAVQGLFFLCVLVAAQPARRPHNNYTSMVPNTKPTAFFQTSLNELETGRDDQKVDKYLYPLLFGFKLTGILAATLAGLKIFTLQSLVVSKVALFGAIFMAAKIFYSHYQNKIPHYQLHEWEGYPHLGLAFSKDWRTPYPYTVKHHEDSTPIHQGDFPSGVDASSASHLPSALDHHGDYSTPHHFQEGLPHGHGNTTVSVRSDGMSEVSSQPVVIGYKHYITKITKTTID